MKSIKNIFPLNPGFIKKCIQKWEINLENVSIRELNRLVDELSNEFSINFLRFEFGIPGFPGETMTSVSLDNTCARACSRPPDPTTQTFIASSFSPRNEELVLGQAQLQPFQ